jgi:phosphate transport system substrate-binding protein
MSRVAKRPFRLLVLVFAIALFAAACGGDDESIGETSGGSGEGEGVSGNIRISGSSTVEPISSLVAEQFQAENPDVSISVDGPGTGDGFELFCNGETDISDASRPIEPEEADACEQNGIEYIELKIGFDGITVLTHPANSDVECLDFRDLYALIGPESEGFETWSDANQLAQEIKAPNAPYSDASLDLVGPGQESGTYDSFGEIVMESYAVDERKQPEDGPFIRPDYQSSPNDNVIIQGIEGTESSLGWVGYAFASEAGEEVKVLPISNEAEGVDCTDPTDETIADGSYPISRSLYFYVNSAQIEENAALQPFVDFYLNDGYTSVTEAGYIELPEGQLSETMTVWEDKETGTRDG